MTASRTGKKTETSFERDMEALERLVAELESGDLTLDKALASFEKGVALVRKLNERLNRAEKKIEVLTRQPDGSLTSKSLEEEDD